MVGNIFSVRLDIKNKKVREDLEGIVSSIAGFGLLKSGVPASCDILILEMGKDDLEKEFQSLHAVQSCDNIKEIFLTSPHLEPELLIQAMRAGAKEFFPQPIRREEVTNALLRFRQRQESTGLDEGKKKRGKIINVIGSKGGVGTTTIAVNLATSLVESKGDLSVALIDMNLLFGEIPVFLNIDPSFNWGEVARNISRMDSTYLMTILSKHSSGLHVLPSPSGLDGIDAATPEIIERILDLMRSVFDFIVIDGGQALDETSLKILEMSDIILLAAILSLPCLSNIKKLLWTFRKLGYPKEEDIRIIVNRYYKKSLISLKDAETSLDQKIYWLIPNDYNTTMSAINQGKVLSSVARGTDISRSFRELASSLLEREKENGGV